MSRRLRDHWGFASVPARANVATQGLQQEMAGLISLIRIDSIQFGEPVRGCWAKAAEDDRRSPQFAKGKFEPGLDCAGGMPVCAAIWRWLMPR